LQSMIVSIHLLETWHAQLRNDLIGLHVMTKQ